MKPFTVEQYIEKCKIDDTNKFKFGIDTVMDSLRPLCLWEVSASGGNFEITRWNDHQYEGPPSSQEIRDEYIRQQTIIECYKYFKDNIDKLSND